MRRILSCCVVGAFAGATNAGLVMAGLGIFVYFFGVGAAVLSAFISFFVARSSHVGISQIGRSFTLFFGGSIVATTAVPWFVLEVLSGSSVWAWISVGVVFGVAFAASLFSLGGHWNWATVGFSLLICTYIPVAGVNDCLVDDGGWDGWEVAAFVCWHSALSSLYALLIPARESRAPKKYLPSKPPTFDI